MEDELTPYEWICLQFAEGRATMPKNLVERRLVEAIVGEQQSGEIGLSWTQTEEGHRLLMRRRTEHG